MRALTAALLLLLILPAFAPSRAEPLVLAELFASENCRSCPAAYRQMRKLAETRPDVLVLTWPVDYWDYLGKRDTMALPESKDRQRGYSERFRLRGPYTPQAVIAGIAQVPGNRPARVAEAVDSAAGLRGVEIGISRSEGSLSLDGDPGGLADLWWISYLSDEDNPSAMPHPVTSARQIGPWLGGRADITLPDCVSGCVLVIQEAGFGRILGVVGPG